MSDCFREDIFGELVELKKQPEEPFKTVLVTQNTLQNYQQHQNSSKHSNSKHSSFRQTSFSEFQQQRKEEDIANSQKQFSFFSTSIGISKTESSSIQLNTILDNQTFPCYSCEKGNTEEQRCFACSGSGVIKGNQKIVKFMQFVLDFKCGLVASYKKDQKQRKEKGMRFYSQVVPKSTDNWRTHEGYNCNGCKIEPIIGVRYHCPDPNCNDDYDLCEDCFCKLDHPHELQQFGYNLMQEKLENIRIKMVECCRKGGLKDGKNSRWIGG